MRAVLATLGAGDGPPESPWSLVADRVRISHSALTAATSLDSDSLASPKSIVVLAS